MRNLTSDEKVDRTLNGYVTIVFYHTQVCTHILQKDMHAYSMRKKGGGYWAFLNSLHCT